MQTNKLSLADIQGKLNRQEMKQIMAGLYFNCSCNNQTGSWTYTSQPSATQLQNDINTYCRNGGTCTSVQQ